MASQQNIYQWTTQDLATIWNDPDPVYEFLAGTVAMRPSVNLWYGAPGIFKTLLLQDLGCSIALKRNWLDPLPGENTPPFEIAKNYPILWVDQDSGETTTRLRFKAFARGHNILPKVGDISWLSCPTPSINLWPGRDSKSAKDAITSQYTIAAMATGKAFVGIDNLGAISGGADENSRDMLDVLTAIRQISEWTNTSINLIHHSNKKGDKSQYGARGHTSILQNLDYAFEVTRESSNDDIATVTCTKSRHIPVEPFSFMWTYQNHDKTLYEARFYGVEPDLSKNPLQAATTAIRQHFQDGMNQSDIVKLVKDKADVGRNRAINAIQKMVRSGELDSTTGQKNSILYCKSSNWKQP